MRSVLILAATGLVVVAMTKPIMGQDAKIERGKYLVEEVARCQECHTPKTETGEFDKTQWMKGATLVGVPATPVKGWHQKSPDITSTSALWTRWQVEGFSKFLQTAKNPRGGAAGPPMPAYMMKAEDADAIAAYLKSLP
ncbi:MAG: c-type cytochrome [Acidobacteriia bacterium]|nr:c-type cytochrome [Terriglobia bacterium]